MVIMVSITFPNKALCKTCFPLAQMIDLNSAGSYGNGALKDRSAHREVKLDLRPAESGGLVGGPVQS